MDKAELLECMEVLERLRHAPERGVVQLGGKAFQAWRAGRLRWN